MIDSSLDIKSKEYLEGIGVVEDTFVMISKNPPNDFIEYGSLILVLDNIVNVLKKHEDIEVTFSSLNSEFHSFRIGMNFHLL